MTEKRTIELPWDEVCKIISAETEGIVGVDIQCKAMAMENEFWAVDFTDRHLSVPEFCFLMQSTRPTLKDWMNALPDEIGPDIKDMGPDAGERMIAQHLQISWEHSLITKDGLWLMGVKELNTPQTISQGNNCKVPDDLARAMGVINNYLHQQEGNTL